jgi:hypothetical protein
MTSVCQKAKEQFENLMSHRKQWNLFYKSNFGREKMEELKRLSGEMKKILKEFETVFSETKRVKFLLSLIEVDLDQDKIAEVGAALMGMNSEAAAALRKRFSALSARDMFIWGYAGVDSPEADLARKNLDKQGEESGKWYDLMHTLAGVDSNYAWEIRERERANLTDEKIDGLFRSVAGLDTKRAWDLRHSINIEKFSPSDRIFLAHSIIATLAGLNSEEAWSYRQYLLEQGADFLSEGYSIAGLDSPRAWEVRERLQASGEHAELFGSLAGIDSERAWALRATIKVDQYVPGMGKEFNASYLARSLVGLTSDRAMAERQWLKTLGYSCRILAESINCETNLIGLTVGIKK